MDITVRLSFEEKAAARLLNWLAWENAIILRKEPDLPLLYESPVVYALEPVELWSDLKMALLAGEEDCDALAAWRAGELIARGADALLPWDGGYRRARRERLTAIPAEVVLKTRSSAANPGGLYHCVVKYYIGDRVYYDDPSARLGMNGRWDERVLALREELGVES